MLIGTPGGTVDLLTGKIRPGKPDDHISKNTAAAPIPLNRFNPARDCPLTTTPPQSGSCNSGVATA